MLVSTIARENPINFDEELSLLTRACSPDSAMIAKLISSCCPHSRGSSFNNTIWFRNENVFFSKG